MKKRKGKIPCLLSAFNGTPKIIQTKGTSKCQRCQISISKGNYCFEMPYYKSGNRNGKRYCFNCAILIISETENHLDRIKNNIALYSEKT